MSLAIIVASLAGLSTLAAIIVVAFVFGPGRRLRARQKQIEAREARQYAVHEKLREHTKEFKKEIIEVTPGCHVAIGYGLANCVLIEGDDGCVLIDALESVEAGDEMVAAFRHVLDRKPIRAIVITHFHTDHAFGIDAFIRGRKDEVKIYAHEMYDQCLTELGVRGFVTFKRGMFQFGGLLKQGERENCGIGPILK